LNVVYVGERKCAYEGCSALEFRVSGFCLRHKSRNNDIKKLSSTIVNESLEVNQVPLYISILKVVGVLSLIVGGLIVFLGILLMFPLSGGYELNAMAGLGMIILGGPLVVLGACLFMISKLVVLKTL